MLSKALATLLFATSAFASPISPRQDAFLPGFRQALQQAGLTTLDTVFAQYASTPEGQQLVSALPNGNYTVFAPSNTALDPVVPTIGNDTGTLGAILSYHILNGSFPASLVAPARSHSIVTTLLTNDTYVNLGGSPQVQVLEQTLDGNGVLVRRTTGNVTVTNSTTYQNLTIHVVDAVLTPPENLTTALSNPLVTDGRFTQLIAALQKVGQLENSNNAASTTIFVPIDAAFAAVNTTVANLTNEQLTSVLQNHVISNSVVYSPNLTSTPTATAASGATVNFTVQDGVAYISYNQTRARILRSDVAVKNGVVHVIDAVLA